MLYRLVLYNYWTDTVNEKYNNYLTEKMVLNAVQFSTFKVKYNNDHIE